MSEPTLTIFHGRTFANRLAMLLAATRPAFLTASVLPVIAAGALVYALDGSVDSPLLVLACLNIALVHSGANVVNDYFDALSGTDAANTERVFPFSGGSRFIQNEVLSLQSTRNLGFGLLAAGALLGLAMAWTTGPLLLLIGLLGGGIAIFYSAPPCLACRGLGDIAIALCFGLLPVIGTTLILTGAIQQTAWWLGAAIGCFVAAILWANSIPDITADRQAGKWTVPARIGHRRAAWLLPAWFAAGWLLLVVSPLPSGRWLALLSMIPGLLASRSAITGKVAPSLPQTIITHAAFCLLLAVGLVVWP